MSLSLSKHRLVLLGLFAATMLVAGCGGGDDESRSVRFINATVDVGSLDLYVDEDKVGEGASDTAGEYFTVGEGEHDYEIRRADTGSTLQVRTVDHGSEERYAIVAWGREGSERLTSIVEDEDEPEAGQAKVRLFNTGQDAGPLDLYLTSAEAALADVSARNSNIPVGSISGYVQLAKGTYRLRITGAGDKDDIRLDVRSIELGDRDRTTIIVQPSQGGALVHAVLVVESGALTTAKNERARVRVAASVSSNGIVDARIADESITGAPLVSPGLSSYTLIPAGLRDLKVSVNDSVGFGSSVSLLPGADYTFMVYGAPTNPLIRMSSDDNRLPSSGKGKLRLAHGAEDIDTLSLTLDAVWVSDASYGQVSSYYTVSPNNGNALIQVTSPYSNTPLYTTEKSYGSTGVSIEQNSVYSVFMLGGNLAPRAILRRER